MSDYQTLKFAVADGIARIELDRPEAANSIDLTLARELMQAAIRCDEDPSIRVVVLSGRGRMFCSGGDLKTFARQGDDLPRYLKEVTTYLHAAVSRLTRAAAPVIAAVHGAAGGAGMSLACAADLVLAASDAKFTMSYTRVGLVPDGGSTYFLARIVGLRRALELCLTNPVLSAAEAERLGIVTRVVAPDRLCDETEGLARTLAGGATGSLGATKRLLHSGWAGSLETQMELETRAIADAARSPDGREGIAAFVGKRPPNFTGR